MQLRRACNHPWLASSYAAGLEAAYEESGAEGPGGSRSEPQGSLLRSAKLQAVLDFLRENTGASSCTEACSCEQTCPVDLKGLLLTAQKSNMQIKTRHQAASQSSILAHDLRTCSLTGLRFFLQYSIDFKAI